jgi:drug/metabolite transporter (DMT)-like permease
MRAEIELRWSSLPATIRGPLWVILGSALFAAQGIFIRDVVARLDPFQMQLIRCVLATATVLPFALWQTRGGDPLAALRSEHLGLHLLRGFCSYAGMSCMWFALIHMKLGDATAITFTRPLFLLVLAAVFLGERIGFARAAATVAGFAGVALIVRPGFESFTPYAFLALLSAFFAADVSTLVKKLSASDSNTTIMFYATAFATLFALPAGLWFWTALPTLHELLLLVVMSLLATAGQSVVIRGYRATEASYVAPFDATRILFAGLYGWWFFLEFPDLTALIGAAILVASVAAIAWHETRIRRRSPE